MKKALLLLSLLFAGCDHVRSEPIDPTIVLDNVLTDAESCVYSTEVDPRGLFYFLDGYEADGIMATSPLSCDAAYTKWLRMDTIPVRLLKA
jgi:hypothetical protein